MRMAPTESAPINVFMVAPHERRDAIPAPYQQSSSSRCVRNQMRWTLPACCARRPRRRTAQQVMNSRRLLLTWVCLLYGRATTNPRTSLPHFRRRRSIRRPLAQVCIRSGSRTETSRRLRLSLRSRPEMGSKSERLQRAYFRRITFRFCCKIRSRLSWL